MDKAAIKKFAVSARKKLIEAVGQKSFELGITEDEVKKAEIYQDGFLINQKFYKKYEIKQRDRLLREMEIKGYEQVIEEVAYTWFNRFIALRFMEVNDYLPTGVRIFSSIEAGKKEPDALTEVELLIEDLNLEENKVYELQDANDAEDLFKYIFIKQCNQLGELMPMMFETIENYTELLLPNNLLAETSIISDMVNSIEEADWAKEVEIIGWLYQYYISEKKDQVFADLKKNKKISKENIPAATELFTPRWIVQYMVDNSLGRLWLESHPNQILQEKLPYYLEEAEQPESVLQQLESLKNPNLKPEEIKFLDPCMGSGHILVYAFEVFYELYKSQGYREQDIPKLIIENNLYGLDLDPRAAQLAYFSVMMKARSYSYRLFDKPIKTNLYWIEDSQQITEEDVDIFVEDTELRTDFELLLDTFENGRLLGSIIEVPEIDLLGLKEKVLSLKQSEIDDMFVLDFIENKLGIIEKLVDQATVLSRKYDVVVTNPPYMGRKGMNAELSKYVKKYYKDSSADLYAVFMEVAGQLTRKDGFMGMVNQHSWMFLSTFEKLRKFILDRYQIYSMAHLGTRAFAEIGGEVVQTTSFVIRNVKITNKIATFIRLTDVNNADKKAEQFNNKKLYYNRTQTDFSSIPQTPIAYWASKKVNNIFKTNLSLSDFSETRVGVSTGDNDKFVRHWYEICHNDIGIGIKTAKDATNSDYKWFPYNKGGPYRKWYGNQLDLINWKNNGEDIKSNGRGVVRNPTYYFRNGITWSDVTSGTFNGRYSPYGFIFGTVGLMLFTNENLYFILGYMNSKVFSLFAKFTMSTMHFNPGEVSQQPFLLLEDDQNISGFVKNNINISKSDWDSFETSWDFQTHPFIEFKQDTTKIAEAFANWEAVADERFQTLKANEEELNRIFIDLYGLQDELTPEVEDKDVTIRRAERLRDVKSFISYSVGLMFGRYSLDEPGLAFAGGEFDLSKYKTFIPDEDNVIPIADDVYFEDDIVNRLITILKTIYGTESLEENLDFIADTLIKRGNETSRQRIRRYFLKEFYKDHVQTYQKRPIYWLFDSGKQDGFKALVYLHRYEPNLVARVRTSYLHTQQKKYQEEMKRLDILMEADISKQEKTKAKKKKETLQKQLQECLTYDQVIAHVAHQTLKLDLDDGVKVNYAAFQNIEVPQGEGKKALKANVLAKL
ncbi:BREX-1 system adenine-specific DNA-methyltransferase PglX [Virgibacillus pantothenticus]|uniref:BREX-1 system adenine-specific DNA-methyltransferase PglX n=1 Tax=Virgibacillus pantothenticus TaxID=1473 RepID=UPI001C239976|nr:BREX-1 system adenine-specific DNA-methyltransferase PglX [Virgibacillus pantothenticus]MBU8565665.1 BREX-1 system adenine-specific DNA-methyltransferase PglX [Virgibacillus pantothenticus]MBU8601252.1 BREX-1 system adenine-specific DNA-methyltransferase PglX [Virgibacillus pantothenticus]MBU8635602.1 BREX-1 system adenine-specific DNA-methyltransferase PglX [Virgibacillus pantothenticus]MBU8643296.1 BREX-1 system adenine-specific DNA-methyltransferase PglX [Virgibacillus pantothenticus]MBU